MVTDFPPSLILFAGALLIPFLPRIGQAVVFPVFPLAALAIIALAPDGVRYSTVLLGQDVVLFEMTGLARPFGLIFALVGVAGGVYALTLRETGQRVAAGLYIGGALGVTFAGDLFTLLVHWEIMAVASTYLIWARRTTEAEAAGWRYLLIHLFGGSLLLGGLAWQLAIGAGVDVRAFPAGSEAGPGVWLILAGVCLNAAVVPLHAWLADAYPKATVTGAVFLSAFTTKSAVYVLVRLFPGWEILLYGGLAMVLVGTLYAVLANDMRQILAYSTISQVGYMVTGVGLGTELAIQGTVVHAFCHILYKALLFMVAGAIIETTGRARLSELGGLGRLMPLTFVLHLAGAAAISGLPPFNGFVSKYLVISAAGEQHLRVVQAILMLGSAGTFLHTGLRLTWHAFLGPVRTPPARPVPVSMHTAMIFLGALCLGFGVAPSALYHLLPGENDFHPYTPGHFVEVVALALPTLVIWFFLRRLLAPKPVELIDMDWFYRRPAPWLRYWLVDGVASVFDRCQTWIDRLIRAVATLSAHPWRCLRRELCRPFDPNADRHPVGQSLLLTVGVVLALALWIYLRP